LVDLYYLLFSAHITFNYGSMLFFLLHLVHQLCSPDSPLAPRASYFPAYEIVMDELRDYRYYADDLVHIAPAAENIIYQRFLKRFVDDATRREVLPALGRALSSMAHKPLLPQSTAHLQHVQRTLDLLKALQEKYAEIELGPEVRAVQRDLQALQEAESSKGGRCRHSAGSDECGAGRLLVT
jgi:hypothetical protein